MRKRFRRLLLMLIPALLCARAGFAKLVPDSVDLLYGYGRANLRAQPQTYRIHAFFVNACYDLTRPGYRVFQFCVEPFYSYVFSPHREFESGLDAAFRVGLFAGPAAVQPYIKAGIGGVYISTVTVAQSRGMNFNEYIGLGIMSDKAAAARFSMEFRYRHISNARLALPNAGIDTLMLLAGLALSF